MPRKSDLDLFFEDPSRPPSNAGRSAAHPSGVHGFCRQFGTLYKLRRESQTCFKPSRSSAPWAGAMCVLAGIDLLACFYAGNNRPGNVTTRFLTFVENNMPPTCKDHKDLVYSLRNCLLHNFTARHYVNKFRLILDDTPAVFTADGTNTYLVNLNRLRLDFEQCVQTYKDKITSGSTEEAHFNTMFSDIGYMMIYDRAPQTLSGTIIPPGRYYIGESMMTTGLLQINTTLTNRASS